MSVFNDSIVTDKTANETLAVLSREQRDCLQAGLVCLLVRVLSGVKPNILFTLTVAIFNEF